jgi:predicted nicotinamide N-methyase
VKLKEKKHTTMRRKAVLETGSTGLEAIAATTVFAVEKSHEFS